MKQIFDWLREQMHKTANINNSCPSEMCWTRTSKNCDKCDLQSLKVREIFEVINEAEAKWEADCCIWEHRKHYANCLCKCNGIMVEHDLAIGFTTCPYCGKRIKISEVE